MVKGIIKNLPRRILFSALFAVACMVVHIFLMVYVNDGFRYDSAHPFLGSTIMGINRGYPEDGAYHIKVMIFWSMVSIIFWGSIARMRALGFFKYWKDCFINFWEWLKNGFQKPGSTELELYQWGTYLGLLAGAVIGNAVLDIALGLMLFLSATARTNSLLQLLCYCGWCDWNRIIKPAEPKPYMIDLVCAAVRALGMALILSAGLQIAVFKTPLNHYIVHIVVVVLLFVILNMTKRKNAPTAVGLMGAFALTYWLFKTGYADDGGWSEAGGTLWDWLFSEGAGEATGKSVPIGLTIFSVGLSCAPVVGDIKDMQEAITGYDLITGEKLEWWERALSGVSMFVPIVSGAGIRGFIKGGEAAADVLTHVDEFADIGEEIIQHGDEVLDAGGQVLRHGDEMGSRLGGSAETVEKYWDEYYQSVGKSGDDISNLIEYAQKERRAIRVEELGYSGYMNGRIAIEEGTKRWEFIEEFLHYKVDKDAAFQAIRKEIRKELKQSRIKNVGRVAEEIAVKQWMLNKSKFLKLDAATQRRSVC